MTTTTTPVHEKTESPPRKDVPPKLADCVELIGQYEGSGFKDPPYIARRADGQVVQLAPLLYRMAELADGQHTYEEIAERVSEAIQRGVSADNVRQLIDERLRPLGVVAGADGVQPKVEKADPMLALKLKAALVPEGVVNALTKMFKPFFLPPVVVAVLVGLVALDVWLFAYHGIAQSMREVLYSPALLMLMLGLVIVSAAFHEVGHASACAYGGARPGVMGAGLYLVWPAFYTDVTDAYRLNKAGRLRTDLGGIYFNAIFILITGAAYFATGYEPLLLIIPFQHLEIVHQLLPFIRLDGYYIVSDLTGVPDMFARIKPTLTSLLPWKKASDKVKELKLWARVVVTTYVLSVVPLLVLMLGLMVINAPRIFSTAYDSFVVQWHKVQDAFSSGTVVVGTFGIVQMLILILPALGIVATVWMMFKRTATAVWNRTEERPAGRAAFVLASAAAAAFMAYIWWPNGEYRPIQPGEKGTIAGAVEQLTKVPTGRPALTEERERALGGAPLISSEDGTTRPQPESRTPTTETPTTTSETPTTTETETTTTETTTTETATTETTTTTATP
jgi:putative peptide zinc metalloprotease protein